MKRKVIINREYGSYELHIPKTVERHFCRVEFEKVVKYFMGGKHKVDLELIPISFEQIKDYEYVLKIEGSKVCLRRVKTTEGKGWSHHVWTLVWGPDFRSFERLFEGLPKSTYYAFHIYY